MNSATSSDGTRNSVLLMHQTRASFLSFQIASSRTPMLGTLTLDQIDSCAADRTWACAPPIVPATFVASAAGALFVR